MNRKIKAIYNANRNWWDSFTSCFIGTLLGIGITFWVSGAIAHREKVETERRIQLLTLDDLQNNITSLKTQGEVMLQTDSLFQQALACYPDRLDEISADLAGRIYSAVLTPGQYSGNRMAETMFTDNIEVWKSIDDLSVIRIIGDTFVMQNDMAACLDRLNGIKERLLTNIGHQQAVLDFNDHHEAMRCFFGTKENLNLLMQFQMQSHVLHLGTQLLDEMLTRIKEKLGITDEELAQLYDKRYEMEVFESHSF